MSKRNAGFDRIPIKLRNDRNIDAQNKLIIALLYSRYCVKQFTYFELSDRFISEELGISKRNLSTRINYLKNNGYLDIRKDPNDFGYQIRKIKPTKKVESYYFDIDSKLRAVQEKRSKKTVKKTAQK